MIDVETMFFVAFYMSMCMSVLFYCGKILIKALIKAVFELD